MGIFLLLILRLWYLQLINTDLYQHLSEKNRIRYIPIAASRGPIYDRNGELLVENRPSFGISALRREIDDPEALFENLARFFPTEMDEIRKQWEKGKRFPRYRPIPLAEDVSRETLEKIQENGVDLAGVIAEVRPVRSYKHGEMAAHLFGYLGEITERDLKELGKKDYRPGDFVGKSGLEKRLEPYLKGEAGERRLEVDVLGKELRILQTRQPLPGNRVYLTLNRDLQLAAEEAFGDQAGAAVALDVQTGEILAMVSRPSYDPSAFARGISGEEWIQLLQNSRSPLQNKAIKGQYPPGSTFKIVTALAALRSGAATPQTKVNCRGRITLGNRDFRCWKKWGHGVTDMKKAIKESCDVWFYEVSLALGIDPISQMSHELGLGETFGTDLEGEKGGLIPSSEWKKKRFSDRWYDGETIISAIGQGYVLTTPLQLAVMTAAVANGGTVWRPYVLKKVEDLQGKVLLESGPRKLRTANLSPSVLEPVREALSAVVNETHGTAWRSRLKEVRFAGKTGTAQVIKLPEDRHKKDENVPYRFRDHALFVAYAPVENPQVAVAVVVEHGSHGSTAAAPIARVMLESYFGLNSEDEPQQGAAAAEEE